MKSRYLIAGATLGTTGLLVAGNASAGALTPGCFGGGPQTCNLLETDSETPALNPNQNDWASGYYVIYDPLPGGGTSTTVSDIVLFSNSGSGYADTIELLSYDDAGAIPPGLGSPLGSATEDASGLAFFSPVLNSGGVSSTDIINVLSPPESQVPEPLTLSLFGAGLAGAVAMRRRKKVA